ncbi:hypothetical protein AR457_36195 [Streptomyces agglomeratus]|uniref:Uncharacterized protein n=1 Tax=Streptomyces agglomeratus TaxID=285458 RepID=A0A1E5NZF3_9ACTN|nr:hypothetical protein AS594_37390 [Streptomyces agglomeratus]OEJ23098.1 hypothetical protein AR457_36195 [Streptomyces agglomeratus]OEJ36794.1 hypothetical protein BGK72_36570 [Streptomyces agglomeratus]
MYPLSATQVKTGVRDATEVERAFECLEAEAAGPGQQTQYARGALAGYLWALGRGEPAPITGRATDGAPAMEELIAETDAATAQMEDSTRRTVPRDYLHGVHDALAWVCGHTDDKPLAP